MRLQRLFILFFFLLVQRQMVAQVYPVQGNAVLIPPYSVYISDYTSRTTDRLIVNVALKDITRPELKVYLRLRIESQNIRIETKAGFKGQEIMLQGGIPLRLTGTDLVEYFNPNNLSFSGITKSEFEKKGALPQGFYQFSFEVYEYNRDVKISNTISAPGWLILNDPPIVNIPQDNAKIIPTLPQNVIFQWTPRHTGSPNSAFSTEYEIRLVEVWPSNRNPNDAILTSPPILDVTTQTTSFIYGASETPLELGRRYAMRVRAKSIVGAEEYDLFKNNGYSSVVSFVYGDACEIPEQIDAFSPAATRFNVKWISKSNHTGFSVRYRQAGTQNWYENKGMINEVEISSLKPGTTYEYQVSASCGAFDAQYSAVATVKTKEQALTAYSCGVPLDNVILDPAELAPSLKVGDIINSGDFDVKLTKVSGSNGQFSGEGVIEVPFFNRAKARVEFTSITVNKDLRMVNGFLDVKGAGVDIVPSGVLNFMDQLVETLDQIDSALTIVESNLPDEMFDPNSFVAEEHVVVAGGISAVYANGDGSVVVVDKSGNQKTLPAGKTYAVEGNDGQGYLVDTKGKIHETTSTVAAKAGNRVWNLSMRFARYPQALYGFDKGEFAHLIVNEYEKVTEDYVVPWKAVKTQASDLVIASLKGNVDKDKIHFEMAGENVSAPLIGNTQTTTVPVPGKTDGDIFDLIAEYVPNDSAKHEVLGKLKVISYDEIVKHLVIVPVNTATMIGTADQVKAQLDSMYHQAVVNWTVELQPALTNIIFAGKFNDGESGLVTNYTDDMRKVISAYKNQRDLQDGTYYLFLINDPKSGPSARGYMPRGKECGFIFSGNHSDPLEFARTIAHELGHGAFRLQHIFAEEKFKIPQGNTDNVMDYPSGPNFYKFQWNKMRFPDIVVGLFEEDEDAEYKFTDFTVFKDFEDPEKKTYTFLTPGGKPITLPATTVMVNIGESYWKKGHQGGVDAADYPLGTLIGFKIQLVDGDKTITEEWVATLSAGDQFVGYRKVNTDAPSLYNDQLTAESAHGVIIGFPCVADGQTNFYAYKIDPDALKGVAQWPVKNPNGYYGTGSFKDANEFLSALASAEGAYTKVEYAPANLIIKPRKALSNSNGANGSAITSDEAKEFLKEIINCGTGFQNETFQIINLIQQNPGVYTSIKECNGGKGMLDKEQFFNTAAGMQAYYLAVVRRTKESLMDKIQVRQKLLKNLTSITTPNKMEDALSEICEADYKMFTGPQRAHILKTLALGDLDDCWGGEEECAEAQIIYTLTTAPEDHRADIAAALIANNHTVVAKLIQGIDNAGKGGNNFDRLSVALIDYFVYAFQNDLLKDCDGLSLDECKVKRDHLLVYDQSPVSQYNDIRVSSNSYFTYSFKWVGDKLAMTPTERDVTTTSGTSYGSITAEVNHPLGQAILLRPFESVAIQLRSPLTIPGEKEVILESDPNRVIVVPAYLLYWMIQGAENKYTMTKVRLSAYAAGFLVGGLEVATAKGIHLVLASVDLFVLATNFAVFETEIAESFPEWKPVIESYKEVAKYYGFLRGGMAISSACLSAIHKFARLRPLLQQLVSKKNIPSKFQSIVDQISKASTKVDELLSGSGLGGSSLPPTTTPPNTSVYKSVLDKFGVPSTSTDVGKIVDLIRPTKSGTSNSKWLTTSNTKGEDLFLHSARQSGAAMELDPTDVLVHPGVKEVAAIPVKVGLFDDEFTALTRLTEASQVSQKLSTVSLSQATARVFQSAAGVAVVISPSVETSLEEQVVYVESALKEEIDTRKAKEKCRVCEEHLDLCGLFENIRGRAITGGLSSEVATAGVNKLCRSIRDKIRLAAIANKLINIEFPAAAVSAFLRDVVKSDGKTSAFYHDDNLRSFSVKLLDAWKIVADARCTNIATCNENMKCDLAVLIKVAKLAEDTPFLRAISTKDSEGMDALKLILKTNERAPCNTCGASTAQSYLNPMDKYLDDVLYFTDNYFGVEGYVSVVGKSGIKNLGRSQVEATAFMLRVLHENPGFFESLVSEFEIPTDQGKRKMDVLLHTGTIVECKSWDDGADTFGDFVQGKGNSYAQFLDYLKIISSMDQLQYWLDGRKLSGGNGTQKRDTAVEKFKALYDGNDNVFNALFNNPQLKAQLFNGLAANEARELYDAYVAQSSAILFGFIKIK